MPEPVTATNRTETETVTVTMTVSVTVTVAVTVTVTVTLTETETETLTETETDSRIFIGEHWNGLPRTWYCLDYTMIYCHLQRFLVLVSVIEKTNKMIK